MPKASCQGRYEVTEYGSRTVGMLHIVLDQRGTGFESARGQLDVMARFGDGECDNLHIELAEFINHRLRLIRSKQKPVSRPYTHGFGPAFIVKGGKRILAALVFKGLNQAAIALQK